MFIPNEAENTISLSTAEGTVIEIGPELDIFLEEAQQKKMEASNEYLKEWNRKVDGENRIDQEA